MFLKFWNWYQKNYTLNLTFAALLFSIQVVHLFWLLLHVILPKLGFPDLFAYFSFLNWPLIIVDYTEIPAIISTSLIYINEIRRRSNIKSWLYLIFLNIQWLHIFWITDEFVLETIYLSGFLWWIAIFIDYLELPVIIDTMQKLIYNFQNKNLKLALETIREHQ